MLVLSRWFISVLCALCVGAFAATAQAPLNKWENELIYRTTLGQPKDVTMLIKKVGNPNLTDSMGYSLLYIAASRNDREALDMVKTLVDAGADINFDGGLGNYPLIAAVQSDNADIVRYLLEKGANYRVQDGFGVSLADYARQSGKMQIRDMIEERVQQDIRSVVGLRTASNLDRLTHQLAFHSCALQYYTYYYQSGQDDIPEATRTQTLKTHQSQISEAIGYLRSQFRVKQREVDILFDAAKDAMHHEMEQLISNRWRRKQGVGQPGDMEKRCELIAAPYAKGYFDKKTLDMRVK